VPRLFLSDLVDFFLEREGVERCYRQAKEETDASVERLKCLAIGAFDLVRCSLNGGWIGDAPKCCHRLARPERAHFFRCVVAHRKNKAEMGASAVENSSQDLLRAFVALSPAFSI
jgi:hypothetical protein